MPARMSFFILMVASFRFESLFLLHPPPPPATILSLSLLFSSSATFLPRLFVSLLFPVIQRSFHAPFIRSLIFRLLCVSFSLSLCLSLFGSFSSCSLWSSLPILLVPSWFNSFLLSRRERLNSLRLLFAPTDPHPPHPFFLFFPRPPRLIQLLGAIPAENHCNCIDLISPRRILRYFTSFSFK